MPGAHRWVCLAADPTHFVKKTHFKPAIQCLPALLAIIMTFVLPESPRWLLMNDRYDQARTTLLKIHSPEEAAVELAQINAQMQIDRHLPNSYWVMFKKLSYRKRSLLAIGTSGSIQFSGILVINSMHLGSSSSKVYKLIPTPSLPDYASTIYGTLGYGPSTHLHHPNHNLNIKN